jgi:RHS repeat-associated protein
MRSFRRAVRRSRWLVVLVLLCTFAYSVEANNYAFTYRVARDKEERLAEMAQRLGVPVEKLRREQPGLLDTLRGLVTDAESESRRAGRARVEAQLEKMADQVAANPYRPQIEEVKNAYRSHRLDGLLRDLTQLSSPDVRSLPVASRKALLRNVRQALKENLEPYVPDSLPGKARARHNELRGRLRSLYAKLRTQLDAPDFLADAKLAQRLGQIAAVVNEEVRRPERGPRFADRPLPLQLRERTISSQEVRQSPGAPSSAMAGSRPAAPEAVRQISAAAIAPEITALAQSLGRSPGRIFAHVHDTIRFDPKWGAVRSPLGTLQEGEGTSWDQAWLLLELLTAAGVEAKVEWGQIEIPTSLLLTLTGTSDPFDAGNLLSTGGVPAVLLTQGGQVVGARLGHPWVKAHIDYIPNRGVLPGTPDTWVRMDPSLKRYGFAAGLDVHSHVPFDLGNYLQSGTEQSPRRSYEDALFAYIRTNHINCANLEQLKKAAQVVRERFPYVPGTLRGKIVRVDGESAVVPASFQQSLTLEVKNAAGSSLINWSTSASAVYGKRVEIDYVGATPEDQATLDTYGGVFETPPYLVDLKPVVRVAGATVAQGSAIGSALDTEVWVTMTAPAGPPTIVTHVTSAGERHILALDFGEIPQTMLDAHQASLNAARAAGNASEEEAETLYLVGGQYLHNLGRDLTDLSGWKWQRLVRLGTEGLISQTGVVTTTVGGAPISFRRGQRNVDIALMPLGMVPADGRRQFRREAFELLGAQSSFLEGEVFNQVLQREGIAAVSALTRSKRAGQTLTRVDGANVDTVLGQTDLGADAEAEIRAGVARGRIGWVAQSRIAVHQWSGTGYVIEDPATGAAAYLISGGYAGGDETGGGTGAGDGTMGFEEWLESNPLVRLLNFFFQVFMYAAMEVGGHIPAANQSDPINLTSGNMWFSQTDLAIQARGLPVVWTRAYNSRSDYVGPLGFGWTFSLGERLEELTPDVILFRDTDGTEHPFVLLSSGEYLAPPGTGLELVRNGNEFVLRSQRGLVRKFSAQGLLLEISERNGNSLQLTYDAMGQLASVIDAIGRTLLTVTQQNGKIVRLVDLAGRSTEYTYADDDLVAVKDTRGHLWTYSYDPDHNLISKADPLGQADSYAYDLDDRCYMHVDPLGSAEHFAYDASGQKAVLADRNGAESYFEFDEGERALLMVDPAGNLSRSSWDESNNRLSVTDSRGGVTSRVFDDRGNVLRETDPLGQETTYTYDGDKVLTATDPAGNVTTSSYDASGNLLVREQVVGATTIRERFVYDSYGQLIEQVDARGNSTSFEWDPQTGALKTQTNALDQTTTFEVDSLGRLIGTRDPAGGEISVTWDEQDRVIDMVDPLGNSYSLLYDSAGRRTQIQTPRGTTSFQYDAAGRLIRTTDARGGATQQEYDPEGYVVALVDARGNRSRVLHDVLGRVLATVDPSGQMWSFGYCAEIGGPSGCSGGSCSGDDSGGESGICELTDPRGHTTRRDFDAMGREIRITDALGNHTERTYDSIGRLSSVKDALDRLTRYEYDERDRLTAVVDGAGARTEYEYDANGNRSRILDAEGRSWSFTYDALNRLLQERDPTGNSTRYEYDLAGNLTRREDADGQAVTFKYDRRLLNAIVLPDGSRETFGYDTLGRQTSMSNHEATLTFVYDELDRITRTTDQGLGQSVDYSYDANGNLAQAASSVSTVQYLYDSSDRLLELRDSRTGTYSWNYDETGLQKSMQYPNGIRSAYEYDANGRMTEVLTKNGGGNLLDGYRYTYNAAGLQTSIAMLRDNFTQNYQYDALNRLTRWERGTAEFEAYSYDRVGNRVGLENPQGSSVYSYDDANHLLSEVRSLSGGGQSTTAYSWSASGNLLRKEDASGATTYQYDALRRLVGIAGPGVNHQYGYAPTGIRVRETTEAGTKRLLTSRGNTVAVFGESGGLETYYSHEPTIDSPLAQMINGRVDYLHRDGLGSVTALSGPAGELSGGVRYAAFGTVEQRFGTASRFGYTSRELDASGLMSYRSRYYDPSVGRFTTADSFRGEAQAPLTLNRYSYVLNNPLSFTDPFGLYCANPSEQKMGIGWNLYSADGWAPHPFAPGICIYLKARALNIYQDLTGSPLHINGEPGYLLPFHWNIKWLKWGNFGDKQGYANGSPLSNHHVGFWQPRADPWTLCFVWVDKTKSAEKVYFKLCIQMQTVLQLVAIFLILALIAAAFALALAGGPVTATAAAAVILIVLAAPAITDDSDPGGGGGGSA